MTYIAVGLAENNGKQSRVVPFGKANVSFF